MLVALLFQEAFHDHVCQHCEARAVPSHSPLYPQCPAQCLAKVVEEGLGVPLNEQIPEQPRGPPRGLRPGRPKPARPEHLGALTLEGVEWGLWSEARSGALGGGGEEERGAQAGAVGSGPVSSQTMSLVDEPYQNLHPILGTFRVADAAPQSSWQCRRAQLSQWPTVTLMSSEGVL